MNVRTRDHRRRLGAVLVLSAAAGLALSTTAPAARAAVAPGAITAAPATGLPGVDPSMLAGMPLDPLVRDLVSPPALVAPAPRALPQRDLATAIARFSRDLGIPRDPAPELAAAHLSDALAGLLAGTVEALDTCHRLSAAVTADEPFRHGVDAEVPLPAAAIRAIRSCAVTVEQHALQLEARLPAADPQPLDIWPVVRMSTIPGTAYTEDYALIVDTGGHAKFLNNAGGNLIDLKRGPQPFARDPGPARGCQEPYPDLTSGRVEKGRDGQRHLTNDGPECFITAALVLAIGGDDQFGALTPPKYPDDTCTADPLESRIATAGSGTAGVGMLIERGSHNTYIGRAQAIGAGHLGGVGLVLDQGSGDNRHLAVATSEGMGLLGGAGLIIDLGRHSTWDYYVPRPLNPLAKDEEDGAGGIINDAGLLSEEGKGQHQSRKGVPDRQPGGVCENVPRSLQGVGLLPGSVGMVLAAGGDNTFRAIEAPPDTTFMHEFNLANLTSVVLSHCNQGCGLMGAAGALIDVHDSGVDSYLDANHQPWKSHRDGGTAGPQIHSGPDPGGYADLSQVSCSFFIDADGQRSPGQVSRSPATPWIDRLHPGGIHRS
jgi:hypothetical protein